MIAQLIGQLANKTEKTLVIDVNGVGYEVSCNKEVLLSLTEGQTIKLFTYLAVREDALDLYGFLDLEELNFFKLLLTVSGIGPKSALNVLAMAKPKDIKRAVSRQEPGLLQSVQGLGKKTAEKIVNDLKDKLVYLPTDDVSDDESAILQAIVSLGYSPAEARIVVQSTRGQEGTLEEKIKATLRLLGRK
ncbi:Holliday junction branch migration protein RuvA [Patescibacteria group bacterium]|nr:Holliday junction branch migration protein RuvA [Patescibacteria group bacterium]